MTSDLETQSVPFVLALGAVGLIVGSFLGTLVLRLPDGQTVLWGRSRCRGCGSVLQPWQLVPLVSWLVQRGRCRHCGAKISVFYPLIELAAAGIAIWGTLSVAPSALLPTLILGWTLLALAVMDVRFLRLSDGLVVPLLIGGLIAVWWLSPVSFADHVLGMAAGFAIMLSIKLIYARIRGREGLGSGDVKLAGAIGAWLGWQGLPSVVLLASSGALLVILVRRYHGRSVGWNDKLAFGSYLCLGTWFVWLYGPINFGGN
jgi:leader peptidase (prepilin peptidase)/N-methyltransferase